MRIPNPIKLIPDPTQLVELAKRAASMLPGVPELGARRPSPPQPEIEPEPRLVPMPPAPPRPQAKPAPKAKAKKASKPKAPKAKAPKKAKATPPKRSKGQPKTAPPGVAVSGFPEPPGKDPGDLSKDPHPHRVLSNPVGEPDPTEWPDPYDQREDPRDPVDPDGKPFGEQPHPATGARSTSEPHPAADPDAEARRDKLARDKLDQ